MLKKYIDSNFVSVIFFFPQGAPGNRGFPGSDGLPGPKVSEMFL